MSVKDLNFQAKSAISLFLLFVIIATISSVILLGLALTGEQKGLNIPTIKQIEAKYATPLIVGSMVGSMKEYVSADEDVETVKSWIAEGAKKDSELYEDVASIIKYDCRNCHSRTSTMTKAIRSMPFESYEDIVLYVESGYDWKKMSKQAHIHMFGIASFLVFVTLIFAYTTYRSCIRTTLILTAYFGSFIDIFSWWFVKEFSVLVYAIYIFGAVMVGSIVLMSILSVIDIWSKNSKSACQR